MEGAVAGVHLEAVLFDKLIVSMQEKMHILSRVCEFPAIVATNGSCSNDTVLHVICFYFSPKGMMLFSPLLPLPPKIR